ncbi:hypothetical protein GLAREA_05084 [Glarea lozoyensis ATCC 20868]|uniref:G-patch domain-containing protein n=1 Tax=Glarea lozoyensis (strain ATCC 20868 / MF5171) TaxID=1116229 RepID=S3DUY6_GLAL2|nr:uncharacterized protein GLAREA_05084 [Glarea lozoyensis ATCC 20868]EPE35746.1 hypothetical protein GLAREA_05084 [Glarea lozoyensis ATCC 20868]
MSDDDEYEIPLQDQRVFGAGIKRKGVKFVPSSLSATADLPSGNTSAKSISDFYLGLVLSSDSKKADASSKTDGNTELKGQEMGESSVEQICEVCNLPLLSAPSTSNSTQDGTDSTHSITVSNDNKSHPHEASLAHQLCLAHSHPPSHLDRNRKGLAYLASYGWDPDSRLGLGAAGQGIQFPIKTKPKDDKMGIGVVLPKEAERRRKEKPRGLDAGKIKKLDEKDKKKSARLRQMFYQNDDVERYLGGGSDGRL